MTGNEAIDMFQRLVDDSSVDDDVVLDFLNSAQDELALERAWYWLTAVDSTTIDWLTSDSYTTQHSVPSNFFYQLAVYVSGMDFPFKEIPIEHRERYRDISYRVFWDHRQRKLHFTGTTSQSRDVTLMYIVTPTAIAADAVDIANWPTTLHRMLVYKAVELWLGGTDADNVTKVMREQFADEYKALKKRAIMLDAKLRGKARNYQALAPSRDISKQPDVAEID